MVNQKTLKVALMGPPNVGKSTLINAIVKQKISIVSHKVQTTRKTVKGIYTEGDTQLIFVDTPGLFTPRDSYKLEKYIVENALKILKDVDMVLLILDSYLVKCIVEKDEFDTKTSNAIEDYKEVINLIPKNFWKKIIVCANKVDTIKNFLIEKSLSNVYKALGLEENHQNEFIFFSAKTGSNLGNLAEMLRSHAKPSSWIFEEDAFTDISERELAEEITREKVYVNLHDEIPYNITIETDKWEEQEDGSVKIFQSIVVLKDSQRIITVGHKGRNIKVIGEQSRIAITHAFGRTVHLFLHVKVRPKWIDRL